MNNSHRLLEKSIESLKMIRSEMHDDMDSSEQAKLDKVIADLEEYGAEMSPNQLLNVLGKCLLLVPAVEKLLTALSKL